MGTYTTNYQLYMPTVGETGWGTLVNGNFTTIDSTMAGLNTRLTAVENEVNGALSCTSVTTSGKITGNGGIAGTTGTFSGAVTGASFNGVAIKSSGTYTVTPNGAMLGCILPTGNMYTMLLPPWNGTYSGSIKFYGSVPSNAAVQTYTRLKYYDGKSETINNLDWSVKTGDNTLTFSNIPYLLVARSTTSTGSSSSSTYNLYYYGFTLT